MLYGKEKRQEALKERIDYILSQLKKIEEIVDNTENPNDISKSELAIKRLKDRWKVYEDELKELNGSEGINTTNQNHKNKLDSDVATALVQLAKAWAADQNKV